MNPIVATPLAPGRVPTLISPAPETRHVDATPRPFVVTDRQCPGEPAAHAFRRLAAELTARQATLLNLMIYAGVEAHEEIVAAMLSALGRTDWPITWVDSRKCGHAPLSGFQAFAISGVRVSRLHLGKRVVGSVFEDGTARHCLLGGLGPTSTELSPAAQTQQTFGNLEWALSLADFKLGDVVRTWFYNDDILAWYGDFNRVRSAHYAPVTFRTGSLPASTGIGARNPGGAALTVAAWAMQPLEAVAYAREVGSPLQCPAPAYGSSFSRAMEVVSGGYRGLFVSGTASIWPDGRTAWVGDAARQIALTMEVVAAILHSRGMDYQHVTRATAYFQSAALKSHFDEWCGRHEVRRLPVIAFEADVCRDDLLFEIEVDAELPLETPRAPSAFDL
jgi:enamine deaminase RidA (YjgF/YER057c/UK114 family)